MTWNGLKGNPRARLFIQEQTAKECNVCFANERLGLQVHQIEVFNKEERIRVAASMLEPATMQ